MITCDELKQFLDYNPETGNFTWKVTTGDGYKGNVAGHLHGKIGHVYIGIKGKSYLASRLAWLYMKGEWPKVTIDHRDRNPSNNKWDNLREALFNQNNMNRLYESRELPKWVYKHGSRYKAQIKINKKAINLGSFDTPEEAYLVAEAKAKELHGEFFVGKK
jgi:hypothetical protein